MQHKFEALSDSVTVKDGSGRETMLRCEVCGFDAWSRTTYDPFGCEVYDSSGFLIRKWVGDQIADFESYECQ